MLNCTSWFFIIALLINILLQLSCLSKLAQREVLIVHVKFILVNLFMTFEHISTNFIWKLRKDKK